jgi:hypothetical protein
VVNPQGNSLQALHTSRQYPADPNHCRFCQKANQPNPGNIQTNARHERHVYRVRNPARAKTDKKEHEVGEVITSGEFIKASAPSISRLWTDLTVHVS